MVPAEFMSRAVTMSANAAAQPSDLSNQAHARHGLQVLIHGDRSSRTGKRRKPGASQVQRRHRALSRHAAVTEASRPKPFELSRDVATQHSARTTNDFLGFA